MEDMAQVADCDLPSLYLCANHSSMNAQGTYLRIIKFGLLLQIAGVVISLYQPPAQNYKSAGPFFAALFFFISLILTIVLKTKQYERIWYGGRAAAESVKTSAWRYSICSDPYSKDQEDQIVDETFIKNLKAILEQRGYLADAISSEFPAGSQITEKMRTIRSLNTNDRLEVYMNQRIMDQRNWYASKAKFNKKAADKLFAFFIVAQVFTTFFALLRIAMPYFLDLTGICAVIAASTLAWLQIKKHQELAQSYAVTAHELGF